MKLLYTGAATYNQKQTNPLQSLGGFVSESLVPFEDVGLIFPLPSWNSLNGKVENNIGLVLKNTDTLERADISFWFDELIPQIPNPEIPEENIPDPEYKSMFLYKIGFVSVSESNKTYFINKIGNTNQNPGGVEFESPYLEENKIELPNSLKPGEMIGIWLKRVPKKDFLENFTPDNLYKRFFDKTEFLKEYSTKLKISYT